MKKILPVACLIALLGISLGFNLFFLFHKTVPTQGVKVIGVIDGDTVVLEGKSRVRLRFVDAPEKGLCGYEQASKVLEKLALGKSVRIVDTIPDMYGRGMALVYMGDTLINKEMLASGWVRYHHDTSTVTNEMKATSDEAKGKKRGIYGACQSTENTDHPTCIIKGNIDKSTHTRIYYMPGCAQYPFTVVEKDIGEEWFCREAEARQAGYTKSKTCP